MNQQRTVLTCSACGFPASCRLVARHGRERKRRYACDDEEHREAAWQALRSELGISVLEPPRVLVTISPTGFSAITGRISGP